MGNVLWTEETNPILIPNPTPCFPNTCEKHIQNGTDENCAECNVFKWYAEQERALQKLAQHKLKIVKEHKKNKRLDQTIKLVETSLEYIQ
tara:strand:+ start:963 stop:1232 length:270 start_codon:yes stop_codon:yes gene_type:complete